MPSQSHLSKAKILATPTDTPYHALIASPRASPARSWQQMMRARLGIDKNKSWAEWAEEEEEAAEPTKTLADAALTAAAQSSDRSTFDNADHDVQLLMMYTRAAFYATQPSNAAAYAPVEACGAHEWTKTLADAALTEAAAPPAAAKSVAGT